MHDIILIIASGLLTSLYAGVLVEQLCTGVTRLERNTWQVISLCNLVRRAPR